jgi:hypothetical protein
MFGDPLLFSPNGPALRRAASRARVRAREEALTFLTFVRFRTLRELP